MVGYNSNSGAKFSGECDARQNSIGDRRGEARWCGDLRRLHAAGANIAIHYRGSLYDALALRAELNEKRPDSACTVQADLLEIATLPRVIEETVKQFGHLDALVNNASSFYPTPLEKVNEQQWNDLLGTNLKAPLFLAQAAAAELRRRHGCIVNIVDIHAERPMHGHLLYNVAKSGLVALTRALGAGTCAAGTRERHRTRCQSVAGKRGMAG